MLQNAGAADDYLRGNQNLSTNGIFAQVRSAFSPDFGGKYGIFFLLIKMKIAERGFDPRTSGLWAQHASTAPLCFACL